jgi:HEAT repeat protein
MKQKRFALTGIIILLGLLLAWGFFSRKDAALPEEIMPEEEVAVGAEGKESFPDVSSSSEGQTVAKGAGSLTPASTVLTDVSDLQILQLQALLDDGGNRKKTISMAVAMTNGTVPQQLAAVEAFRWLGGREAVKALIKLRNEAYPEVAEEAGRVLGHLLATGLYAGNLSEARTVRDSDLEGEQDAADGTEESAETDEDDKEEEEEADDTPEINVFDAALWEQAIREAPTEADREELLILLSAYPGTKSVPVLLNLLESENSELREHALEYLEFVTYGEEITTRQQGEDWLAKHGALEEFTP